MAGVIISYQGTPISNLTATAQKTLLTSGKYCESDIEVAYTAPAIEITATFGSNAFKSATGLTSICGYDGTTAIGDNCFNGCTNLTSVSGFASLTTIGTSAFQGCSSLTTLPTEPTITSFGVSAFQGCTALTTFNVPTNVSSLSNKIFYGCTALTDLVIHGTVNNFNPGSAGNAMTYGASNLARVTLPGGTLGAYVLYNNTRLERITIGGPGCPVTSINNNAFYGCTSRLNLYVYTEGGVELSHATNNYWGCNNSGTTCTFIDSTL